MVGDLCDLMNQLCDNWKSNNGEILYEIKLILDVPIMRKHAEYDGIYTYVLEDSNYYSWLFKDGGGGCSKFTRWQSFKIAKRLCLVDDLKMLKITMSNTSSRNKLNPEINDHYNILTGECQKDELKTKDKALYARLKVL
ncbi:hypothetical protein Tco_1400339 [Tanacetum coccineum]